MCNDFGWDFLLRYAQWKSMYIRNQNKYIQASNSMFEKEQAVNFLTDALQWRNCIWKGGKVTKIKHKSDFDYSHC